MLDIFIQHSYSPLFQMLIDMRKIWLLLILACFLSPTLRAQHDVIMQGFYWNSNPGDLTVNSGGVWWDSIATVAPELGYAGFETVWVPPPTKGFAGRFDMGYGAYDYFDLGEFDQKGTIRTRHGDKQQLMGMIDALHQQEIKVMADVVLNHRAGAEATQPEDCDHDGDGVLEQRFTDFDPASGRLPMNNWDFHPNATHCDLNPPYHNRIFFEDLCYFNFLDQVLDPGAPNDGWYHGPHKLGQVGDSLIAWGRYLLDGVGFDELRIDAVKHIEPGFLAPFLVEMSQGEQPFAVGEFFDGNLGALKGYHGEVEGFVGNFGTGTKNANMALFDFNLRNTLRDMANDNGGFDMWNLNSRGLKFNPGGGLDGEDIVTFIENHDTDRTGWRQVDCPGGDLQVGNACLELFTDYGHDPVFKDKHMAYAYIMAAEGRPTVFWKDWFWYGLKDELQWQMALRSATAEGGAVPIQSLNPFFTMGNGGDLFAMNRYGSNGKGLIFAINDNPSSEAAAFVNAPFSGTELKDYSDAYLFTQTRAFDDGRVLVKAGARNYAWYAPTGQYPQPAGAEPSAFTLGSHQGAKLHFVVLRAQDAAQLLVNGAPIQPGDQVAIMPQGSNTAVGLGRIGQSFAWDGTHDMIIEVLGGDNAGEAKGGLLTNEAFDLWVYDQSQDETVEASTVSFASSGTSFQFSANRPASRGGSAPFGLTTTAEGTYAVGGISLISDWEALAAPTALNVTLSGDTAFIPSLRWDDLENEDGYIVYRDLDNANNDNPAAFVPIATLPADQTLFYDETGASEADYYVTAYNDEGESAPSNMVTYQLQFASPLSLSYLCYDADSDSLTWQVDNSNPQAIPFIYAQWWSTQRDTLYALPDGSVVFQTKNNPQDPNTFGDDNITGVWYWGAGLQTLQQEVTTGIELTQDCGLLRTHHLRRAPRASRIPGALDLRLGKNEYLAQHLHMGPNPFNHRIEVWGEGLDATATLRIINSLGQQVKAQQVDLNQRTSLDLSLLSPGSYLLQIQVGEARVLQQIQKR